MSGPAKITKESRDAIASGIDELTASGYVTKERVKDAQGRFTGMNYTFFEIGRIADNPISDNPISDNPIHITRAREANANPFSRIILTFPTYLGLIFIHDAKVSDIS